MRLVYTLNFTDFLEHQMYGSSKSKLIKKDRKKKRIIVPIIYLIMALITVFLDKTEIGIAILVFAIIWYLLYPLFSKFLYKRHFKKHVNEHFKKRIGKEVEVHINIDQNFIETSDYGIQTKINVSELDKLIELKEYFFLRLKTEISLIIPKRAIIDQEKFKKLFSDINLEYVDETNWEWK